MMKATYINRFSSKADLLPTVYLLTGIALLALAPLHAVAADKNDKQERAAQRRLQQMQQVQQKLEQENTALKEQIKELETKFGAAQATSSRQQQNMSKLQAKNSEQDTQLSACMDAQQTTHSELVVLQEKLGVGETRYKQLSSEKSQLEIALSQQKNEVQACQEKNISLLNLSTELMKKYEKQALSGVEPLTGLKGVGIENSFQDYRDQAENQLYRPRKY